MTKITHQTTAPNPTANPATNANVEPTAMKPCTRGTEFNPNNTALRQAKAMVITVVPIKSRIRRPYVSRNIPTTNHIDWYPFADYIPTRYTDKMVMSTFMTPTEAVAASALSTPAKSKMRAE